MNLSDGSTVLAGVSAFFVATAIASLFWSQRRAMPGGGVSDDLLGTVVDRARTGRAAGESPAADVTTAAQQLAAALEAQASLFDAPGADNISGRCFDNFSIGYLAGFVDAALHQLDIGSEARTLEALEIVARHLTRPAAGAAAWLLQDLARLHFAGDDQFMRGLDNGATDARAWLRREIDSPARWADYVLHETTPTLN